MTSIDQAVIESLETWEEIGDAARLVAADLDTGRFTLGDIANRCARVYGRDSLGQLATEIRVAKRQTLFEYAKVAARFEVSARAEFVEAGLTFSHFRAAVRAKDDAELWLARAADENWNVAEMARAIAAAIGKPVPPVKLYEGRGRILEDVTAWPVTEGMRTWMLLLTGPIETELTDGLIVTVKVYEGTGAE